MPPVDRARLRRTLDEAHVFKDLDAIWRQFCAMRLAAQVTLRLCDQLDCEPSELEAKVAAFVPERLDEMIDSLNLSLRAYRALRNDGIESIADLLVLHPYDVRSIPGIGDQLFNEIRARLAERGLKLKGDE